MTILRVWGILCLLTAVFLWCGWHVIGRTLVKQISPLTVLTLRCVFACPFLFSMARIIDPIGLRNAPRVFFPRLFSLGILLVGGNSFLFLLGLKWTSTSEAALFQPLIIVFTTVIGIVCDRYNLTSQQFKSAVSSKWQAVGIISCIIGAIWILISKSPIQSPLSMDSSSSFEFYRILGFICLIGNTMCFSVYTWMQLPILSHLSPVVTVAFSYGLVTPLFVIFSLVSCSISGTMEWMNISKLQLVGSLYSGICSSGIATVLYSYANKWLHPTVCGLSAALQPLVSCILGAIFLEERLSFQHIIAAVFIIGGVTVVLLTNKTPIVEEKLPSAFCPLSSNDSR
ncbi:unnamed protein product [Rotaria sp. Silwood2]|nr:unnamed protein product [Rotaria sp. Silwood2]CAF4100210.1 unnamed protein product [Rotaria sp. Silwood2]